jgi:hypothetical protein
MTLSCLGGQSAPAELARDLELIPHLSAAAEEALYSVLGPCLAESPPRSLEKDIEDFARAFEVDDGALTRAIRACRFLLRAAAVIDLPAAAFSGDLGKLGLVEGAVRTLMLGYEAAKTMVRGELVRAAVGDHGKLVDRIDWRVDHLSTTNRGARLSLPIALVTLNYHEGDRRDRITFQLLPETLRELRVLCERLLGGPG